MKLSTMRKSDIPFVYECLGELRGDVRYTEEEFSAYCESRDFGGGGPCTIYVAHEDGERVGMMTCNRFGIPRYLGDGIDIEELVIPPKFRGRGLARRILEAFLEEARGWPSVRKVVLKPDDMELARKVYEPLFGLTDFRVFARKNNLL